MIQVIVADDEAMIRAGIRGILSTHPEIEVVAEAADGREAVDLTRAHRPDVVLLDIRMPRMDGLLAAAEIRRQLPATAVMLLTTFSEDGYIAEALRLGAAGFLLKSGDPHELIAGVQAVAGGAAYLAPTVAARVLATFGADRMSRTATAVDQVRALTARERDVLALVGAGQSNGEIAARLHLVEGTVKGHVSAILNRLGARNRVQAAIVAYEAGLVDPSR